jgi:hypothetical protein
MIRSYHAIRYFDFFQIVGALVMKTSKIFSPLVGDLTNWAKDNWKSKLRIFNLFRSPVIIIFMK